MWCHRYTYLTWSWHWSKNFCLKYMKDETIQYLPLIQFVYDHTKFPSITIRTNPWIYTFKYFKNGEADESDESPFLSLLLPTLPYLGMIFLSFSTLIFTDLLYLCWYSSFYILTTLFSLTFLIKSHRVNLIFLTLSLVCSDQSFVTESSCIRFYLVMPFGGTTLVYCFTTYLKNFVSWWLFPSSKTGGIPSRWPTLRCSVVSPTSALDSLKLQSYFLLFLHILQSWLGFS